MKTVYKASNINGKFSHLLGKRAALAYARTVERDDTLTENDLVTQYGWTFKKVSASVARSFGFDV